MGTVTQGIKAGWGQWWDRQIYALQFGFTENSSTLQQMLLFMDSIINHPSQTDVIYVDISKAFDTVSHCILLNKLWHLGITGSLLV